MAETGFKFGTLTPIVITTGSADLHWINLPNVNADDGNAAGTSIPVFNFGRSDVFATQGHNLGVPVGATPVGIEVKVKCRAANAGIDDLGPGDTVHYAQVLVVGGVQLASSNSAPSPSDWPNPNYAEVIYGGPTDLLGFTGTVADLNADGFGWSLACARLGTPGSAAVDVDAISINVHYTGGAGASIAGDVPMASTPAAAMSFARHPALVGDVPMTMTPAAALSFASGAAIVGNVPMTSTPAAVLRFALRASIAGDVPMKLTPAAGLAYLPPGWPGATLEGLYKDGETLAGIYKPDATLQGEVST